MYTIDALSKSIGAYLQPHQVKKVRRAYQFGARAHAGQKRASGEAYIHHPLAVARILGEMHMDHQTLMAAMIILSASARLVCLIVPPSALRNCTGGCRPRLAS